MIKLRPRESCLFEAVFLNLVSVDRIIFRASKKLPMTRHADQLNQNGSAGNPCLLMLLFFPGLLSLPVYQNLVTFQELLSVSVGDLSVEMDATILE